jgi:hypothetical protein
MRSKVPSRPPPPDMAQQPVLVIEVPREFCYSSTTEKFFDQKPSVLEKDTAISHRRWAFIGKFLIVHANFEQVTFSLRLFRFLFFISTLMFLLFYFSGLFCFRPQHSPLPDQRLRPTRISYRIDEYRIDEYRIDEYRMEYPIEYCRVSSIVSSCIVSSRIELYRIELYRIE